MEWKEEREKLLSQIKALEDERAEWRSTEEKLRQRIAELEAKLSASSPQSSLLINVSETPSTEGDLNAISKFYNEAENLEGKELMKKLRDASPTANRKTMQKPFRAPRPSQLVINQCVSKLQSQKQINLGLAVGDDEDPNANFLSSDEESDDESSLAVALYDYTPEKAHTTDLSFSKGDAIFVFSQEESGWWLGETHGEIPSKGMFPCNHVQLLETPLRSQMCGRFQLKESSEYDALATRVFPDIRSTKVRDVPKDRVWCAYNRVLGKDNNVYLQLKKGDWVFMYDFDDSYVAIRDKPLVEQVRGKDRSPAKSPISPATSIDTHMSPDRKSPAFLEEGIIRIIKEEDELAGIEEEEEQDEVEEPFVVPEVDMKVMVKRNAWYNSGRIAEVVPNKDKENTYKIKVNYDVKALKPEYRTYPPKVDRSILLINMEKERSSLKPKDQMLALGMFTVEDPKAGWHMGWYEGQIKDVKPKGQNRWRVVVKYFDGSEGASDHPATNLLVLFDQRSLQAAEKTQDKPVRSNKIHQVAVPNITPQDVGESKEKNSSLLKDFFRGDGLMHLIDNNSVDDLARNFPVVVNAVCLTPIWLVREKLKLVDALGDKIKASPLLTQLYAYLLDSGTCMDPSMLDHAKIPVNSQHEFWEKVREMASKRELVVKGATIQIDPKHGIRHPMQSVSKTVTSMKVLKVFESNTRPFLAQLYCDTAVVGRPVLIKFGDDFRQDVACMNVFELLNFFWKQDKRMYMGMPVNCKTYQCVAGGPKLGFIEFVKDCKCLYESKSAISSLRNEQFHRLIASGAGSYIASYVLGIRDRHADNILIHRDGTLFHIDFGHVLGDTVTIDTHPFAITSSFKKQLGRKWPAFLDECIRAFMVLRRPDNAHKLIQFAVVAFSSLYPEHKVVEFLSKQLYMNRDIGKASLKIRKLIESAPNSYRTRFKNALHAVAVSMKG